MTNETGDAVRFTAVVKRYGAIRALDEVTFAVARRNGGLLGPNSDGKATAMRDLYPRPLPLAGMLEQANLRDIARQKVNILSGGQIQRVCFTLAAVA